MARQISIDAAEAFMSNRPFKRDNTEVVLMTSGTMQLFLFGNCIAQKLRNELRITSAGYSTVTTKDRLNALPGVKIYQKDFQWYLNDLPWDGEWIEPSKIILRTLNIDEAAA